VESGVVQTTAGDGRDPAGDGKRETRKIGPEGGNKQCCGTPNPYPANPHSWDPEDVNGGWVRTRLAFVREGQLEAASISRQRRFCRFCGDGPSPGRRHAVLARGTI
jgi:hypothetical protein